jgi:hypothetical protein
VTAVTVCGLVALAGCGGREDGIGRAGRAALAVDALGCPDLDGTYQVSMPPEREGSQAGTMEEAFRRSDGNRVPIEQIRAVDIRRTSPGNYTFRWRVADDRVQQQLGVIREFEKPRYRRWYHLLYERERADYVAAHGQAAYDAELARLGPETEVVRTLAPGNGLACKAGWLELPRGELRPMRLTRGDDGSVIGEFKGLKTVGITVWCGDGCRDLPIPTGTFTGEIHWPRLAGDPRWQPGNAQAFQRPIDEIEAEDAARVQAQRDADARRYLPEAAIRARIEAMAPAGTTVEQVEVGDGKVRIRYSAPTADMDTLLGRIAGASRNPDAPKDVVRGGRSSDLSRRYVEFALTDSPLVLRDAQAAAAAAPPALTMAVLSVAPPQAVPAGMAAPAAIRDRLAALLPPKCTITDVRYGGEKVTLLGTADSNRTVSDALRALDGAGTRPELLSIRQDGGKVHFEVALAPTSLTRN